MVKYYSTLDDNVFNSEKKLIDYIKEHYVKKVEEKDSDLLTKVSKEFPDWEITMEPSSCRAKNRFCLRKENQFIEEYYGYFDDTHEKLIKRIKENLNTINYIIEQVNKKYNFYAFRFKSFTYGYSDDEISFDFKYKIDKNDEWINDAYYIDKKTVDEFIKELSVYFIDYLEGKPESVDDGGYFVDYSIGNIPIGEIMNRAKKVRLEVIQ